MLYTGIVYVIPSTWLGFKDARSLACVIIGFACTDPFREVVLIQNRRRRSTAEGGPSIIRQIACSSAVLNQVIILCGFMILLLVVYAVTDGNMITVLLFSLVSTGLKSAIAHEPRPYRTVAWYNASKTITFELVVLTPILTVQFWSTKAIAFPLTLAYIFVTPVLVACSNQTAQARINYPIRWQSAMLSWFQLLVCCSVLINYCTSSVAWTALVAAKWIIVLSNTAAFPVSLAASVFAALSTTAVPPIVRSWVLCMEFIVMNICSQLAEYWLLDRKYFCSFSPSTQKNALFALIAFACFNSYKY
jgi:hypothetical protein